MRLPKLVPVILLLLNLVCPVWCFAVRPAATTQTSLTFDDAGRETGIDYPTGTDPTFGYDNADRQTSMVDSTGTYSWTYDAADEATALSTPQGNLSYTYNSDGARHTMVESVGTTTYGYDADGRLTSLANPYSETTSWTYDAADRCTQQTFGSGAYTAYGYDTRNRLTSLDHKTSAAVLISAESYGYDSASNLTSKTVDSVATSYGYDWVDQLTSESRTGYSASYTYDANGNRASKTLGGITDTYHVNDVDELTSITRPGWLTPVKSYTYDDAGRTTSVTSSSATTSLNYDYEGRLTQITYPGAATNTFTYNALDTRVGKVDSAGTATYKRDGVDVTDPVLSDGAAAYTPGISERRSSATKYLHEDFLGSTTRLTDSSQATTATKTYDAFGNVVSTSGSNPMPFGFAGGWGYQSDADSGLQLLGHRYYDPSTGRFLTRDPMMVSRNWYTYCGSSPLSAVDEDGFGPHRITGFTWHGLSRAIDGAGERPGVASWAMNQAVNEADPVVTTGARGAAYEFRGAYATVVLNEDGKVITTWATSKAGYRGMPAPSDGGGSGGGLGVITTLVFAADAGYRGIGEVVKYRRKIQAEIDYIYSIREEPGGVEGMIPENLSAARCIQAR